MHTVVRRGLAGSAVAAMALAGLSGCGGDDSSAPASPSGTPAVSVTPTTTDATPTPSPVPTATTDSATPSPLAGTPVSARRFAAIFEAALDKATTADITLRTTGQAPLSGSGQIDFRPQPPEIAATLSSSAFGGKADLRLVGGVFYLRLASLGPKFISYRLDDPKNPFGALISGSLDPSSLAEVFRRGITAAVLVGTEAGLKHYDLRVDSRAILAQYPANIRSQAAALLPKSVEYNMFFDGDGLLRRTQFDLGSAGTTDQSYDHWGTKVDIAAPPAGDVTQG